MSSAFDSAYRIVQRLTSHGFIAYFAGGWVRDFLMNHPSDDIDIATDATTQDMERLFDKTIPVGVQFGIIIVIQDSHHFEVATFRKDHGYEDGRRPIGIEHSSPEEDALRRDFTINGMFYNPLTEEILDFVGGKQDLEKKLIKAIGNPHQRFLEDRLRMIRAIRYSCRFHFTLDEETKKAIIVHANSLFPSVAIERVWQEFSKMKKFGSFHHFLLSLHEVKLLGTIFPSLSTLSQKELEKKLSPLQTFPKNTPLIGKVLALFPEFDIQKSLELCDKLKVSNLDKNFVKFFHHLKDTLTLSSPIDDYHLTYLYADKNFDLCFSMFLAFLPKEQQVQQEQFHTQKQNLLKQATLRVQQKKPVVTSKHLQKAGISPGILMGKLLKKAEIISINEHIDNPEIIIKQLKKSSLWP